MIILGDVVVHDVRSHEVQLAWDIWRHVLTGLMLLIGVLIPFEMML